MMIGKIQINLKMKYFFTFIILIASINLFSQENPKQIFARHLLIENILLIKDNRQERLYDSNLVKMEIDTLNSFYSNFDFYRFTLGKNKVTSVSEDNSVLFSSSSCKEYIIAVNNFDNSSYKLKGFNTNDLLFLLRDIKKLPQHDKSYNQIIKDLDGLNLGVNFKKIFKDIRNMKFDTAELKPCSHPLILHGGR